MQKLISLFIKDFKVGALLLLVGSAVLSGCATTPDEAAKKVDIGMDKASIIELMGNPDHTDRVHGSDRWIYDAQGKRTKPVEIYFTEGKVSMFGKPMSTAEPVKLQKGTFKEVPVEKGVQPLPTGATVPPKAGAGK